MKKRLLFFSLFFLTACVTVNIYFPAAAVQRAADKIVEETWGEPGKGGGPEGPRSERPERSRFFLSLGMASEAFAQEPDINVSNPAIRALKASIKRRSDLLKPYLDKGNVGIAGDGLLTVRSTDGLGLRERAEVNQLVEAENGDREALYSEIARANNFPAALVPRIKAIFAKSWTDQARPGWWIQDPQGNWKKK